MSTALAVLLPLLSAPMTTEEPFVAFGFDAALARAKAESKPLFIDFMAMSCMPCRKMEKDTWAASGVRSWLGENAIAIQVDVDIERELAKRFRIEATPTVVALWNGEEFDRVVGYRGAAQFLAWGRDVHACKRASDRLLERSKELRDSQDAHARYDLAQELTGAGRYDEALSHYLWLWPATRAVMGFGGVRLSFMLTDMADLAQKHEASRRAFEEIFSDLQGRIDIAAVPSFEDWREWSAFCQHFGGNKRIVAWYEKHRDESGRLLADQEGFLSDLIVSKVFDVLIQEDRALDAGRLYDAPQQRADGIIRQYRRFEASASMDADMRRRDEAFTRRELIEDMSKLYAVLLFAERKEDATAVAAKLLETLDTPEARIGLVRRALELTKKPSPGFARWLDEAEAAGGDVMLLRGRLGSGNRDDGGR